MFEVEDPLPALPVVRRFTRAEFNELGRAGILAEDEHVELLFGQIVKKAPIDPSHVWASKLVYDPLVIALQGRAHVFQQSPFAASDESQPAPDIMVAPFDMRRDDHPAHIFLAVEVSRSSLRVDRGVKARLYALASVDEYWIVDLVHDAIEVRRGPDRNDGTWGTLTTHKRGDSVTVAAFPDVSLAVDAILGPVD
jgi:Uma2 family endonuclease